jgi:hypothetical protein
VKSKFLSDFPASNFFRSFSFVLIAGGIGDFWLQRTASRRLNQKSRRKGITLSASGQPRAIEASAIAETEKINEPYHRLRQSENVVNRLAKI